MPSLNNKTVTANYGDTTITFPPIGRVTVIVSNNGVYIQYQVRREGLYPGAEMWEPEQYLPPGAWQYEEVDSRGGLYVAFAVRAAAPGVAPAPQVTVLA